MKEFNEKIYKQFETLFFESAKNGIDYAYMKSLLKKDINGLFIEGGKIIKQTKKAHELGVFIDVFDVLESRKLMIRAFATLQNYQGFCCENNIYINKNEFISLSVEKALKKAKECGVLDIKQKRLPPKIQKIRE